MYEISYVHRIRKRGGVELYNYTPFFDRGNTRSLHGFKIYN